LTPTLAFAPRPRRTRPPAGAHGGGRTASTPAAPAEVALVVPMRVRQGRGQWAGADPALRLAHRTAHATRRPRRCEVELRQVRRRPQRRGGGALRATDGARRARGPSGDRERAGLNPDYSSAGLASAADDPSAVSGCPSPIRTSRAAGRGDFSCVRSLPDGQVPSGTRNERDDISSELAITTSSRLKHGRSGSHVVLRPRVGPGP